MRIGVFICHCGNNIAATVDVEKVSTALLELPDVVFSATIQYTCSDAGQKLIRKVIKDKKLTQAVVASCSPLVHENTFRRTVAKAGLNPYSFEMANIREHCSWIHEDKQLATSKAYEIVKTAIYKVAKDEKLYASRSQVNRRALIIGGGITGIQAALDIADGGREVILVEREPSIGGNMAKMDKVFPTLDCSACILAPKMVEVHQKEKVKLYTYTEVESVSGYIGNFKVKLRRKARYVDEAACTGCGECSKVCPVNLPDEFNEGLGQRKAVYIPFPQAVPKVATIDKRGKAPCRAACPIGSRTQGYISLIAEDRFDEALQVIAEDNPFPAICGRICQHPCEDNCKRSDVDEPLAIAALKRAAVDYAEKPYIKPKPETLKEEKIAIIGGGPAGLTAAETLAEQGYRITLFEAQPVLGGMMRLGIPAYRLPREILDKEIQAIIDLGVEVKTNTKLGKNITIDGLFKDGYKAVFLGIGAQKGRSLGIDGESLKGVYPALDFLREINLGHKVKLGDKVAVIGGGNTAIDTARTVWRMGAESVTILYRRTKQEMPAVDAEIEEAEKEGIIIKYLAAPTKLIGDDAGKLTHIECIKMELGAPDASGRRRPIPIDGSEFIIAADTILPAIGQSVDADSYENSDIKVKRGLLQADKITLATNIPGVFAGGDVTSGPATVTDAIWAGKAAAVSIDRYIKGEDLTENRDTDKLKALKKEDIKLENTLPVLQRQPISTIPLKDRNKNFAEVEQGLSRKAAIAEAGRCLSCAGCGECRACEKICEANCIDHRAADKIIETDAGGIVVATGFGLLDWKKPYGEYGHGKYKDVITALQYERLLSASGPKGGHVVRPSDGKEPKTIAFICCVGSREGAKVRPYCSAVCCMYTAKQAILTKEHIPDAQVFAFNMDVQIGGKNYAQFIDRAKETYGIKYVRGRVSKMFNRNGRVVLRAADTLLGMPVELEADLVVLAVGIDSAPGALDLAKRLNISHDVYGFFNESHPKLRPVESSTMGIYLAGACQGPKDIPTSVAQASSVSSKVLGLLSKDYLETSPMVAEVNIRRCIGCFRCQEVCPFNAIEEQIMRDGSKLAKVNPATCQGCGLCNATCLPAAVSLKGFTDDQLLREVDALCNLELSL